jgi:hypothetical protein
MSYLRCLRTSPDPRSRAAAIIEHVCARRGEVLYLSISSLNTEYRAVSALIRASRSKACTAWRVTEA